MVFPWNTLHIFCSSSFANFVHDKILIPIDQLIIAVSPNQCVHLSWFASKQRTHTTTLCFSRSSSLLSISSALGLQIIISYFFNVLFHAFFWLLCIRLTKRSIFSVYIFINACNGKRSHSVRCNAIVYAVCVAVPQTNWRCMRTAHVIRMGSDEFCWSSGSSDCHWNCIEQKEWRKKKQQKKSNRFKLK